jgi:DNA-binding MarR family transcriptional regulator
MDHLHEIERAMVTIRRRQTRRAIAGAHADSVYDALDAVEAAEEQGERLTIGALAGALHVDQPRASRIATAAVDAGLLARQADPDDSRRSCLVRTAAGRRASAAVHRRRRAVFAAAMAGWSARDQATFARLLDRFVAALEAPDS